MSEQETAEQVRRLRAYAFENLTDEQSTAVCALESQVTVSQLIYLIQAEEGAVMKEWINAADEWGLRESQQILALEAMGWITREGTDCRLTPLGRAMAGGLLSHLADP